MRIFPKLILSVLILVLLACIAPISLQAQQVNVNSCVLGPGDGSLFNPFNTLTRAVASSAPGSTLAVQTGSYPEHLTIQKNLTITAIGGQVLVGEYYVGTQEICVPIIDQTYGLDFTFSVNCAGNLPGVRAKLYYPTTSPGGATVACGKPFPLIVYAHGKRFISYYSPLCDWSNPGPINEDYRQADGILSALAAAGFIVISVDVTAALQDISGKAEIMLNTIAFARNENARSGSPLAGAVNLSRVGLAGHSTGGGAAIEAANCLQENCHPRLNLGGIRAAALGLLAPGSYTSSDISQVNAPVLVIYGTRDSQQVQNQPLEIYGFANQPKHLVMVTGANHFGYTDGICLTLPNDNPSEVGGATGQEAQARQQRTARSYVRAFFSYYLRGDVSQLDYLLQQSGQQCGNPGNPPACGAPRRRFDELERLNVGLSVCSCVL